MPLFTRSSRFSRTLNPRSPRNRCKLRLGHVLMALVLAILSLYAILVRRVSGGPPLDALEKSASKSTGTSLPKWIKHYVAWHSSVRAQFPGEKLFTDPKAPPILIRTCLGLCGGLNDRLGQLPWDLYLANQTGRVLLLHWHRPVPLENFLVPNGLDWSVPQTMDAFFSKTDVRVSRNGMKEARAITELFEGYNSENPEADFWVSHLDDSLRRATTGSFKNHKVLRHRILGHLNEDELEKRMAALGETDMIHDTEAFGHIFRLFFKPSPGVQKELDLVYNTLKIQPQHYSAVHCRVRHPKAVPRGFLLKGQHGEYPADKTGLPWTGETRQYAIEVATRAIQCAKTLQQRHEPLYFFADSNDLVNYMAKDLQNPSYTQQHASEISGAAFEASALDVVSTAKVISRNNSVENAHIDRQKGRDPSAYYATFVDLYLAINARCITYGIGFYAVFASKISGIKCKLLYQSETWGGSDAKTSGVPYCQL